jgi:hypothetical protein
MEKEKSIKLLPVRVMSITGKSALVEWVDKGGVHRASLPADKVGEKVDQELLDAAPPFGVPWAELPIKPFTGKELQAALYAAGLWTAEDVMTRPQVVIGALQGLLWLHLGSLVEFAAKHKLNTK